MGALCRYRYLPRLVELADAENELYVDLTAQIAQRLAAGDSLDDDASFADRLPAPAARSGTRPRDRQAGGPAH